MILMVLISLVFILTIGANLVYIYTSLSIVNPESPHSRINIKEEPLPEQKNGSLKMCQTQSKPLEKQGHTRSRPIIGRKLLLTSYFFQTNAIGSMTAKTNGNGSLVEMVSYNTYEIPTFTDAAGEVVSKSTTSNTLFFH